MYQKLTAVGLVAGDLEQATGPDGDQAVSFGLAVTRKRRQERTLSLRATAIGRLGELAAALQKGDLVQIEGWALPPPTDEDAARRLLLHATAIRSLGPSAPSSTPHFVQALVVGYLGRDPEPRYTPQGIPLTIFSVAASRPGEEEVEPVWFRIVCWRRLAELTRQYLRKGRPVLAEGDLDITSWVDRSGRQQAAIELTASTVRFLGARAADGPFFPGPAARPAVPGIAG